MSAIGSSVIVKNDEVTGGVYPDILDSLSKEGGCKFVIKAVPRARLERMFASGEADILVPAVQNPERDAAGIFVPTSYSRATLISLQSNRKTITTAKALLERKELKVAIVRGFGYGLAYDELVRQLEQQGRLLYEVDPRGVAKLLKLDIAQVTIMAPTILAGAIQDDIYLWELTQKLRYEPIDELTWGANGLYVSKTTLSEADQNTLRALLEKVVRSGAVWQGFKKYYPPSIIKESIRPR
jgi:polar amino acid transport system substrate-binding protein